MSFPTGAIEEKYEVLRKLAEGGMGAVYVVRHRLLDELRVIKIIRPHLAEKDHLRKRFHQEARAAIKLRHPHIAQIYDFVIDENDVGYTVMELVDGLTLKEISKVGPPPVPFTLEVAAQALQALGYLHRQGYLHRDVAPDNIMVTADLDGSPLVKVIDLGLAKRFADELDLTNTGMFVGKVRYASPEQFARPRRRLSPASDLYSFGIVLYQMLTGVSPIQGTSFEEVIAGHLLSQIPDFSETDPEGRLSPEIRRLLLDLLAKDPGKRPQTAEEALARLDPLRSSEVPPFHEIQQVVDATGIGGRLTRAAAEAAVDTGPKRRSTDAADSVEATKRLSAMDEKDRRFRMPTPSPRHWGALVAVTLLLAGAFWIRRTGSLETLWLSQRREEPPIPTATNVAPGRLVIDAVPWARVVSIEDPDGRIVELGPDGVYTPAVLTLPAGSYTVTVSHPSTEPRELRAKVPPSSVFRASADFGRPTAEGYLADQGLLDFVSGAAP